MKLALALLLFATVAQAQLCNPDCATQPAQCCNVQGDSILAEQCTGATSDIVHFVLPGTGTAWVDLRLPATFSVSGLSGTTSLGDVMPIVFAFTIGTSDDSARFQVIDTTLTVVGQCVTTRGNDYTGLPKLVSIQGRALLVSGRNPLFCRQTNFPDILCFSVKGQVGPPFIAPPEGLCDPDRVEYACGKVQ